MDTLTHIVLGACIGEVIAGKQLGKKVLVLGALAQNLPDIDFVASMWLPTTADLLAHRGITHSLLFVLIVTPLLARVSAFFTRAGGMSLRRWALFWGVQALVHIFIDAFNAYGTGWFEPFSSYRVSFNTMYVADTLFSIWPAVAMIMLLIANRYHFKRARWARAGLVISGLYLLTGIGFKLLIDGRVKNEIDQKLVAGHDYFTTPTPLNNLLWYIVVRTDSGYNIGYRSVLDGPGATRYHYAGRNDSLLARSHNERDKQNLLTFSQGYYTMGYKHDSLVFNNLRFGEIMGWEQPQPDAVLYYFLDYPDANKLIVQRGRVQGWDKAAVLRFVQRMGGN